MLQIPLSDLDIEPGRVYHWRLRPPDDFDPARSSKAASYNQEKHFSAALAARMEHAAEDYWVAMTLRIDGQVDLDALELALRRFVQRHEVLRCGFEQIASGLHCDVMTADEVALERVHLGVLPSAEAVRRHLGDTFSRAISALSWPLFLMGVVEHRLRSTVFLAFDHIVCDGMSLAIAVEEIQRLYTAATRGHLPALRPAGSYLDFGVAQRHRYATITADGPELAYWRSFIAGAGSLFPQLPLELGLDHGHMYPAHNETTRLLDDAAATEFEALCDTHGVKLSTGLLAVVGMSLHEITGHPTYHGFMPISERRDPRWRDAFGWFVNTLPITFPIDVGNDFAAAAAGAHKAFRALLPHTDVPFIKAWQLLAPQYFHLRTWPYPVNFFSFIDYRRMPGAEHYPQWRPTTIPEASHSNTGNMWFLRNHDGIHLNMIYSDTPRCRAAMTSYRDAIAERLVTQCRATAAPGSAAPSAEPPQQRSAATASSRGPVTDASPAGAAPNARSPRLAPASSPPPGT